MRLPFEKRLFKAVIADGSDRKCDYGNGDAQYYFVVYLRDPGQEICLIQEHDDAHVVYIHSIAIEADSAHQGSFQASGQPSTPNNNDERSRK